MKLIDVVPALPVVDIVEAVAFYTIKFAFKSRHQEAGFAILERDQVELHLWAASDDAWKQRLAALKAGTLVIPQGKEERVVVSGAETFLAGTASCRIQVEGIDDLYAEYRKSGVLYTAHTRVSATAWGTREFPALDLHRNLLTFFERV